MHALRNFALILLAAAAGVLAGCGGGPRTGREALPGPADLTARAAFRAAAQVGRAWRPDARLVLVSTSWQNPTPDRLRTGRGAWAFYFVSPGGPTEGGQGLPALVVTVADGRAEAAAETVVGPELEEVVFLDWKVDSDGALDAFLRAGGGDFLADRPEASVAVRLLRPAGRPTPEWRVTALDGRDGRSFQVRVDAVSGAVVGSGSGGGR